MIRHFELIYSLSSEVKAASTKISKIKFINYHSKFESVEEINKSRIQLNCTLDLCCFRASKNLSINSYFKISWIFCNFEWLFILLDTLFFLNFTLTFGYFHLSFFQPDIAIAHQTVEEVLIVRKNISSSHFINCSWQK